MKKLRVGVIGLGVGARHAAGYASHPACEVAALCDTDEAKLREFRGVFRGTSLTRDANKVLGDPTIDAVSIASYDADHFSQIAAALKTNKHVLAEKPLCLYPREAAAIHRLLAQRPGVVLSAHFPLRSTPRFRELVRDVRHGAYGQIYALSAEYNYGRVAKITSGWRANAVYYSVILDGAIHLIDLLGQVMGERVARVAAAGNKIVTASTAFKFDDYVSSLLVFEGGAVATVTANFGNVTPHIHPLRVYGTKASFEHDLRGAWRYTSRDPRATPEEVRAPYRQERQDETSQVVHDFVEAILNQRESKITPKQIFDALAVCFAIEKAHAEGRWVPVEYFIS